MSTDSIFQAFVGVVSVVVFLASIVIAIVIFRNRPK